MENMKVIIRREYDPFWKEWGYIAAFPEVSANPGRISCLPFRLNADDSATFYAHEEVDLDYYYHRKIVHAKTEEAEKCRAVIERYYNSMPGEKIHLRLVEKIR